MPDPASALEAVIQALVGAAGLSHVPVPTASGPQAVGDTRASLLGELAMAGLPIAGALKGGKSALDMSHAARMRRAADQGFDVGRPLYHGTTNDFREFSPGRRAIYLTDDPEIAGIYAEAEGRHRALTNRNAGPNVMPLYAKSRKPLVVSDLGPDGTNGWSGDNIAAKLGVENPGTGRYLHDEARRQGYDLIEIRDMSDLGGRQTQLIPLEPRNVRSRFASFDPAKISHNDLLASLAGGSVVGGLMMGEDR